QMRCRFRAMPRSANGLPPHREGERNEVQNGNHRQRCVNCPILNASVEFDHEDAAQYADDRQEREREMDRGFHSSATGDFVLNHWTSAVSTLTPASPRTCTGIANTAFPFSLSRVSISSNRSSVTSTLEWISPVAGRLNLASSRRTTGTNSPSFPPS